jgi:hypothetical protein
MKASTIHKKDKKDKSTVVSGLGLMNSTSFSELYIYKDYSRKCEKNEF